MTGDATDQPKVSALRHVHAGERDCVLTVRDRQVAEGRVIPLRCVPHVDEAQTWAAQTRRVDGVTLDLSTMRATARGVGWRLPFRRPVPLSIGLGLAALGVPALVVEDAS